MIDSFIAPCSLPLPPLPASLKQVKLNTNHLTAVPPQICSPSLSKLQKLDLSFNHLASVPAAIGGLVSLVEINLDSNLIVALPEEIGALKKLKSRSITGICPTIIYAHTCGQHLHHEGAGAWTNMNWLAFLGQPKHWDPEWYKRGCA